MKFLLSLLLLSGYAYGATTYSARVNLNAVSQIIERVVGSSLVITTTGGSTVSGASVRSVQAQVWMTGTGSSVVSYAYSPPSLGPGMNRYVPGDTGTAGGSLTLSQSFVFHAPSIYPQYGSSVQVGTQTYSVGAIVQMSDGSYIYPTAAQIKILPMPLPDSQITGWH